MTTIITRLKKISPVRAIIYILLGLFSITCLYPLIWLVINSVKTNSDLFDNPWGIGKTFEFSNYVTAWENGKIGKAFFNSALVSLISVFATIIASSMAAYALKRLKWKLSPLVLGLFAVGVMIPLHSTLIPLFFMFTKAKIIDSYISLILPYIAFALPTSILILTGFIGTLPREMEEAAVLDGCSIPRVFFSIIFPLTKPAIATISIFNFVAMWNELMFALVFNKMTLPVSLTLFKGQYSTSWTIQLAAIVIMVIPSILVYAFLNDKIIKSLAVGAVKG